MIPIIPLLAQVTSLEDSGISFGWLFFKTIVGMVVVIALAFFVLRYLVPRLQVGRAGRLGSRIKIVERAALEPRKVLYLIQIDKRSALIGTSDQGITKVMDLGEVDVTP